MKKLLLLFLFPLSVYSQYCPSLGPNQILPCGVGTTTLTADLSQCGPGGPNPNQTTNCMSTKTIILYQSRSGTTEKAANKTRLFRLFKLFRVPRLFALLNVNRVKQIIGDHYQKKLDKAVQNNDEREMNSIHRSIMIV